MIERIAHQLVDDTDNTHIHAGRTFCPLRRGRTQDSRTGLA
jgi:hypothetical protein